MAIRTVIDGWLNGMSRLSPCDVTLVLHTSCVNFQYEDLQYLRKIGMPWCIPDNVRIELELLTQNGRDYGDSPLSRRAEWILRNTDLSGRTADGKPWDLEQLYLPRGQQGSIDSDRIARGPMLFLFGDRYKMYEFLEHSRDLRGHYVLVLQEKEWSCTRGRVAGFSDEQEALRNSARSFWSGRECLPVDTEQRTCPKDQLRRIKLLNNLGVNQVRGLGIPGAILSDEVGSGSYATVYRAPSGLREDLVKLYKNWDLVGNGIGKIRALAACSSSVGHLPLAMPRLMLQWSADQNQEPRVIGYTMKTLKGEPARSITLGQWPDGVDPGRLLRRIGALLVEVHARGMLCNDLSYNNVLVSEDGNVGFVDCDSFQIRGYPGGQITSIYRHPELSEAACERMLRKPIHEYFAFTVLMYQLIMGVIDPLNAVQEESDQKRDWKNTGFPLEWNTTTSSAVGSAILDRWNDQDEATRRLFADVFRFRSSPSIGAILRELDLL